jgi:hypothetical protein
MLTLRYRLAAKPNVDDFAERDYRRQLTVLIEDKAMAELAGLVRVSVAQSDLLGDPVELAFDFRGDDNAAAAMGLKAFLDEIQTVARSQKRLNRLHRSAVIRPVEELAEATSVESSGTARPSWQAAFDQVRKLASRDTLGPLFLEVDARMSSEADGTVVFAFSGYRFQNNSAWVDRFTNLMRPRHT